MMRISNVTSIVKVSLLNSFPFINKFNKKSNKKVKALIAIGSLLYLAIFAFITLYMFLFGTMFSEIDKLELMLYLGISMSVLIVFFSNITKSNSFLFRTKDYDLLMSLPFTESEIVTSKLCSLYLYNMIFAFTIQLSCLIVYNILGEFNLLISILYMLMSLFIPIIPIIIGSAVAFVLGFIPIKAKLKNILSTLFYLLLFLGYFYFYTQIMNEANQDISLLVSTLEKFFLKVYYPSRLIVEGINGNYLGLLLYIAVSAVLLAIFIFVIAKFFKTFNNYTNRSMINKNYKLNKENYKISSAFFTLFKKELNTYISIPQYVMNTIVGPILSLIATIFLISKSDNIIASINTQLTDFVVSNTLIMGIIVCLISFCLSMTTTSSSSISLEGKNFWIIKTIPVDFKTIAFSKIALNVFITLPFGILDIILLGIFIKSSIIIILLCVLTIAFMTLSFSIIGLYLNILLPKFHFDNPMRVIKQGGAVGFNVLLSFVLVLVLALLMIIPKDPIIGIVSMLSYTLILFILSLLLLLNNGKKVFEKING